MLFIYRACVQRQTKVRLSLHFYKDTRRRTLAIGDALRAGGVQQSKL